MEQIRRRSNYLAGNRLMRVRRRGLCEEVIAAFAVTIDSHGLRSSALKSISRSVVEWGIIRDLTTGGMNTSKAMVR
jgi:hypothetical protein